MNRYIILAAALFFFSCNNHGADGDGNTPPVDSSKANPGTQPPQNIPLNITGIFPHDTTSFTEGLQIYDGKLYEGAGDFAKSAIEIYDLKTGKILQKHVMGTPDIFGEGITIFKGKLYQLTWQTHIAYEYNVDDITKPIKTFSWPYEGWGMTNDGTYLIVSDGQPKGYLYYVDPENFKVVKTITVQDNSGPVNQLNELEYIDGFIYANVWMTDNIVKIDPSTGNVVGIINCAGILKNAAPKEFNDPGFDHESNVLNGIAYDSTTKKMYITGKRWPRLFEVTLN